MSLLTGLLSYYKFDENTGSTLHDATGNGHDGTWGGTLGSQWTTGIINSGGRFNGSDNYVEMGNVFGFDRTDSFSFSFGIRNTVNSQGSSLFGKIATLNAPDIGYSVEFAGGNIYLTLNAGATFRANEIQVWMDTSLVLPDGTWHHVIVTYDGSSAAAGAKMYFDGAPKTLNIDSDTLTSSIANSNNFRIGAPAAPSGVTPGFAPADLDEAAIYARVLNSSEASQLYNSGAGLQYPFGVTNSYFFASTGASFREKVTITGY